MNRIFVLLLAGLVIVSAGGWMSPALAAGEGVISGQVVNKTAGGSPVGAAEVTLTTYTNNNTTSQKSATDAAGKFEFKGLSLDPGTTYTVGTTFQEAEYTSEVITLTADRPAQTAALGVYDSTTSDENIQVSNGHIVVYSDQGHLEVLESWRFNNVGNKTFIGTKGKTLVFTLPAGATSLSPVKGTTLETTATGAASTAAVPPGVADINFTYFIPFEGSSVTITRKIDYPVASFRLLVQDTGVKVASNTLTPAATQMMNGTNFLNFTTSNLAKGVDLDASFSNLVAPTAESPQSSFPWPWLLAGFGMLAVMLIIAYPSLKRRQQVVNPSELDDEDGLIRELARLDDAYGAGTMPAEPYRRRRAQVKTRLMAIYGQRKG